MNESPLGCGKLAAVKDPDPEFKALANTIKNLFKDIGKAILEPAAY